MWYMLFVFGTVWWWALFGVVFICLLWAVEEESGPWAAVLLFAFVAAIHLLGDAQFLPYIKANPKVIFLGVGAYFVIGFLWSMGKYSFKMSHIKTKIQAFKEQAREHKREYDQEEWQSHLRQVVLDYKDYDYAFNFSNSTKNVVFWATYWPWSMLWTLLDDPIRKVFTYLYENWIKGVYRAIHNKTFGNVTKWES